MCNRTTTAKAFVRAASALAIALFTIGMGVNATWACTSNADCGANMCCNGINEKICESGPCNQHHAAYTPRLHKRTISVSTPAVTTLDHLGLLQ